jgi:hypothetical protein
VIAFVQPLGIGLPVALAFVGIYLTALHKPQPHQLPVGVVASPGVVAQLQRSISARAGDAVALWPAPDAARARHQLQQGQLVAAWLPGPGGQLLVAGAQGSAVTLPGPLRSRLTTGPGRWQARRDPAARRR